MEIKRTISTIFMVRILKIDTDKIKEYGFINAYSFDKRKEVQYENAVYLLFKPPDITLFQDFIDSEYERTDAIIDDYNYEDGYVVLVYKLDKKYDKDFQLIRQGKYSKLSEEFKEMYPKKVDVPIGNKKTKKETSLQWLIFEKDESLKQLWEDKLGYRFSNNMELWSIWEDEKETMDLDKLKELI